MNKEILLIEDDDSLNRAISLKLSQEGYQVYRAESVGEAELLWKKHPTPMIICDVDLPDGNGVDFCVRIRKESDVVFLFVTAMDTETDVAKGYAAGADDYITKPFYLTALMAKVNAMMKRYAGEAGPERLLSGSLLFDKAQNRVKKEDNYISLTAKEQSLLSFFLLNPMRILSKNQLLEAIWEIDGEFVDDNTLAVNIRRLREKIEEDPSHPIYLKNVRGLGYIWEQTVSKM
ncbi:MAG: response regulator transcription factor [Blautia sp.]|nr:response regulator transcription factor [Lachnoclostridium sp.]MCM1210514.1 response regulator transcription factor [Blautia sp.]